MLSKYRSAFCIFELGRLLSPRIVTTDFAYVRLLGDRYEIEKKTKEWGRIVEDKTDRLRSWAEVIDEILARPEHAWREFND